MKLRPVTSVIESLRAIHAESRRALSVAWAALATVIIAYFAFTHDVARGANDTLEPALRGVFDTLAAVLDGVTETLERVLVPAFDTVAEAAAATFALVQGGVAIIARSGSALARLALDLGQLDPFRIAIGIQLLALVVAAIVIEGTDNPRIITWVERGDRVVRFIALSLMLRGRRKG